MTLSITSADLSLWQPQSVSSTPVGQTIRGTAQHVMEKGAKAVDITGRVGLTFAGFLIFLAGALGKTLSPEKTAWDFVSFVGMIGGAIMSFAGFFKIWQANKTREVPSTPLAHEKVTDGLENTIRPVIDKLSQLDSMFLKAGNFTSRICKGERDANLQTAAVDLFKHLSNDEMRNRIGSYSGGTAEKAIDFTTCLFTTSELKDKIATLIGFIIGSRVDDAEYRDLVDNRLKDNEVENGTCELFKLLPDEFRYVYAVARSYDREHNQAGQENAVTTALNRRVDDLETVLSPTQGSANKDAALQYLSNFAKTFNYLKIMQQAITYVLQVERLGSGIQVSPAKARNAALVRHALVSALHLQGKDLREIHSQLEKILTGDERNTGCKKGLSTKVQEAEAYLLQVQQMIGKGKAKCRIESQTSTLSSIFPQSLGLIGFKEIVPQPLQS